MNLVWVLLLIGQIIVTWFASRSIAAVILVLGAWVWGTWWGYLTAHGEVRK